jgi:hypothetical protein
MKLKKLLYMEFLLAASIVISLLITKKPSPPQICDFRDYVKPTRGYFPLDSLHLLDKIKVLSSQLFLILPYKEPKLVLGGAPMTMIDFAGRLLWASEPQVFGDLYRREGLFPLVWKWGDRVFLPVSTSKDSFGRIASFPDFNTYAFTLCLRNTHVVSLHDIDKDGELEVLLSASRVCLGKEKEKRIAFVSLDGMKKYWEYKWGTPPIYAISFDVDKDGYDELLCGVFNAENGVQGRGFIDWGRIHFYVLDRFGNVVFKKTYWGLYSDMYPLIMELEDGEKVILITHFTHYYWDGGTLEILSIGDWKTLAKRKFEGESPFFPLLLKFEDRKMFVIGTSRGRLLLTNLSFDTLKELNFKDWAWGWDYIHVIPLQCADLDGDGADEIILDLNLEKYYYKTPRGARGTKKNYVLLLDSDLSIKKIWDKSRFGAIYDINNDGINEVIVARDSIEIWGFK